VTVFVDCIAVNGIFPASATGFAITMGGYPPLPHCHPVSLCLVPFSHGPTYTRALQWFLRAVARVSSCVAPPNLPNMHFLPPIPPYPSSSTPCVIS
jgi:hypothetical protein